MKAVNLILIAGALGMAATLAQAQNLAIVNGKPVPSSRADLLAKQLTKEGRSITPELQEKIKENVIMREILMQEAQKRGLAGTDNYKDQLELARESILINELRADFQQKNPVTDEEIKAEYDKFAGANNGKEYHARHILVEKEDQAKTLIAQIKKGAKFEDLAKKSSKDPGSAAKGGDLDWANANSYVKEFSEAMVKLAKGKFTEVPVKTQFGYHIIKLEDVRTAQLPPLEQFKAQISEQLHQQKLMGFIQSLKEKAKIE